MNILYDNIGKNYNNTRKADPFISTTLTELLIKSDISNGLYLDVGCGTGNYTTSLVCTKMGFIGIDPSKEMLKRAKMKSNKVDWIQASVENLPFSDLTFDGVLATLTIHHWTDLSKGLSEIYRVMKPSSKLVIFTSTQEQMNGYWLKHYFPVMMEASIAKMPSQLEIAKATINQGFSLVLENMYSIKNDLEDLFLYSGKNNPEMYFSSEIRKGISSFANLSNEQETILGLTTLNEDIKTGAFKEIKDSYENGLGDYSFFVYEKNV